MRYLTPLYFLKASHIFSYKGERMTEEEIALYLQRVQKQFQERHDLLFKQAEKAIKDAHKVVDKTHKTIDHLRWNIIDEMTDLEDVLKKGDLCEHERLQREGALKAIKWVRKFFK